jgi:hypothetical protein
MPRPSLTPHGAKKTKIFCRICGPSGASINRQSYKDHLQTVHGEDTGDLREWGQSSLFQRVQGGLQGEKRSDVRVAEERVPGRSKSRSPLDRGARSRRSKSRSRSRSGSRVGSESSEEIRGGDPRSNVLVAEERDRVPGRSKSWRPLDRSRSRSRSRSRRSSRSISRRSRRSRSRSRSRSRVGSERSEDITGGGPTERCVGGRGEGAGQVQEPEPTGQEQEEQE